MGQAVPAIPEFRARGHGQWHTGAAPIGVAFLGRTSTGTLQDPVVSLARQYRGAGERLPEGFCIVRCYWDVESGGIDLDARSQDGLWRTVRRRRHPPRRGHGRAARRHRLRRLPVQRGDLRGHQPGRPGHAGQPAAGKRAPRRRGDDLRDQRADRRPGPAGLDHPGPADADGRIGVLPVQPQDLDVGRAPAVRHRRAQHRPLPLRVRRGPHPAPQPHEGQHGRHPRPAGPPPRASPLGHPHVRVAGLREAVGVRHRPPPHRARRAAPRPGPGMEHQHRRRHLAQPEVHRPGRARAAPPTPARPAARARRRSSSCPASTGPGPPPRTPTKP